MVQQEDTGSQDRSSTLEKLTSALEEAWLEDGMVDQIVLSGYQPRGTVNSFDHDIVMGRPSRNIYTVVMNKDDFHEMVEGIWPLQQRDQHYTQTSFMGVTVIGYDPNYIPEDEYDH